MGKSSTEQLNTRVRVVKNPSGKGYTISQLGMGRVNLNDIGNLIREGYEIEVFTEEGLEYTKEVLTKTALIDIIHPTINNEIITALSEILDEEILYLIIENGGIENYLTRKARGAIYERI